MMNKEIIKAKKEYLAAIWIMKGTKVKVEKKYADAKKKYTLLCHYRWLDKQEENL